MHRDLLKKPSWVAAAAMPGLLLSLAGTASAATFVWEAPAGCPERDAVRWRVEEALGTKLENAAPLSFVAKVGRNSANRWFVKLDVAPLPTESVPASTAGSPQAASGNAPPVQHRTIEASNCEDLAQATGVAIALALGADLSEPSVAADTAPSTPTGNAARSNAKPLAQTDATPAAREAKTKKESTQGSSFWLGGELGPVIDRGTLPGWAPGVEGAFSLGMGAFSVRLGGIVLPSETTEVSGNAGGAFALYAATAALCGSAQRSATLLRLCLGSEIGSLTGRGVNVSHPRVSASTWVAPRSDLDISLPLGDPSLRAFGRAALVVPLIRKEFDVDGLGPVHQPSSVAGRLGVGLELLWP